MRLLIKAQVEVQAGNAAFRNGTLREKIRAILADLRPEAVYFAPLDGQRTLLAVVNVPDESSIPLISEPLFLALNARVEVVPVFAPADFEKIGEQLGKVAQKYA